MISTPELTVCQVDGKNLSIKSNFKNIEKQYFLQKLSACSFYLEYGAGESTLLASSEPNIKTIRSIETTSKWIKIVNENITYSNKDVNIDYIDINSDENNWGYPKNKNKIDNWSLYQQYCYGKNYDLCFIDGRFRVSSFLHTYINAPLGCNILIHDYPNKNSGRTYYKDIEKIAIKKEQIESLAVFVKSEDLSENNLLKAKHIIHNHFSDPR